jgi:ATP-binding cassette subfamily F protein 3
MAIVTLQDVFKSYNSEVVLDGVNLHLYRGEKVGMVGSNGSGKSTILKIILGETAADKGQVIRQKGLKIGYLPQEAQFDGSRTVMEEMHAGFENLNNLQERIQQVSAEMEKLNGKGLDARMREYDRLLHEFESAGGYEFETEIEIMLAGVGFEEQLKQTKTSALSGGQLSRLGLAKVLITEADLLLLDEPTNHLDLQATEWLERYLAGYKGAVVLVSHDRFLLDRLSEKIIEVENGRLKVWKGNYSGYIESRRIARLEQKRQYEARTEMV